MKPLKKFGYRRIESNNLQGLGSNLQITANSKNSLRG